MANVECRACGDPATLNIVGGDRFAACMRCGMAEEQCECPPTALKGIQGGIAHLHFHLYGDHQHEEGEDAEEHEHES